MPTQILVLVDITLFFTIYLLLKPAISLKYKINKSRSNLSIIFIVLFCIYAFYDLDYFSYLNFFESSSRDTDISHLESVYLWIAHFVGNSYLLFRLVIWGGAFWLLLVIFKRSYADRNIALLFFITLYLTKFAYGRVSLAMALAFCGFILIFKFSKRKLLRILYILFGLVIICSSYFFHKSTPFVFIIMTLSILALPMNRKMLCISGVLYIFIIYIFQNFGAEFVLNIDNANDSLVDISSTQGYLLADKRESGIGAFVQRILERIPYYIIIYIYVKAVWQGKYEDWPVHIKAMSNCSFCIIILSTLFAFGSSINTTVMYYRFLYFSMIPNVVMLSYCYSKGTYISIIRVIYFFGLLATCYTLLYCLHIAN